MTEEDYEFFLNKRVDRVYLRRSLSQRFFRKGDDGNLEELVRPFQIVSKVIDGRESHEFFRDGKQVSLRITDGERQEIKARSSVIMRLLNNILLCGRDHNRSLARQHHQRRLRHDASCADGLAAGS